MKILVVDDHELIREAMQLVLRQLDANIEVLEAGNCADALAAADRHPDLGLILLDIQLPAMAGAMRAPADLGLTGRQSEVALHLCKAS